ncbi:MAG: alpha/beta fold hydrolase [Candidatus Sericytochromatia bacterium]
MHWEPIITNQVPTRAGRLEYARAGEGAPAVVLINGAGGPIEGWSRVYHPIARETTVFAYNRFGMSQSDAPSVPQDGRAVVEALRELLAAVGVEPPYVLVGHSIGGLYANLFARCHPDETAGVVLLDASHPSDLDLDAHQSGFVRAVNGWLGRLKRPSPSADLDEIHHVRATAAQIAEAPAFPDVPLIVVSGGKKPWMMPEPLYQLRATHQHDLARLSPLGERRVASRSGHFPQLSEPDLVLEAIRACLDRARQRSAWRDAKGAL